MTEAMTTQKEVWIEPEIRTLDVNETAGFPNRGGDGGRFVDCTKS
ncbi:hypothetical protein [Sphingomonas sp. Leaf33]|nr:hypothetical protein [Sphingomonas sp. Leaf33]